MSNPTSSSKLRHAWFGVDSSRQPAARAVAWRLPLSAARVNRLAADGGEALLPADGARCTAPLAMSQVFTVRLDPPSPGRRLNRLAEGMLDLRLPVAVESCAVALLPGGSDGTLLAFAAPRDRVAAALEALRRDGFPAERLVPLAYVLWQHRLRAAPPSGEVAVHALLHVGSSSWTLAIGQGAWLHSAFDIAPGDGAAAGRALRLSLQRLNASAAPLFICGDEPAAALREALAAAGATAFSQPDAPAGFLAEALALDGLLTRPGADANLRLGEHVHPAALLRRARQERRALAALAGAVLLLAVVSLGVRQRGAGALRAADAALTRQASTLAGYPLPTRGAAAVELARRELDSRLNPFVEAFAQPALTRHLPTVLTLAAQHRIAVAQLDGDGQRLQFAATAPSSADLVAWRDALRRAGLSASVTTDAEHAGGIDFTCTILSLEALP